MGKNKNKIRVKFVGNNSEHVTGSMTLIEINDKKILIECGLIQGQGTVLAEYKANTKHFPFKPKTIDYIFVGHLHADHICGLPRLYANGCTAKIIAPKGTYEIAKILMEDSAFIMSKDVEMLKKKTERDYSPIYTKDNVKTCLQYWNEFDFNYPINLCEEIKFNFIKSGHIINSAQIELYIKNNNLTKKILYTSDLGSNIPKYYADKFQPCEKANLVIGECTYSSNKRNATNKDRQNDLLKIKSVINEVCKINKGKVLIPSFALDRTQNIITHLYNLFKDDKDCPLIIMDSPMAVKLTKLYEQLLDGEELELYRKILNWDKLKFAEEYEESKFYQTSKEPMVLVSCSGMLSAGRSVTWCEKLLRNSNNCILFIGFSAQNTLATKIKQGKNKTIKINGKQIPNKCQIVDLKSFSSHMQHDDLLKYYSDIQTEKIALVHGDFNDKCDFTKELQEEISKKNKTSKVICVNKSTELLL